MPVEVKGQAKSEHRYIMNTHFKLDSVLDERYSGLVPISESSHNATVLLLTFLIVPESF